MKFYAVRKGRECHKVVTSWDECSELVTGFPGAIFKSFRFKSDAEAFANEPIEVFEDERSYIVDNKGKGECLMRKSYRDPFSGIYYKNRCVMRFMGRTIGSSYKPSEAQGVPF